MFLTDEGNPYNNPQGREREEDGMFSKYEIFDSGAKAQLKQVVDYLKERWNGTEYEFYKIVAIPDEDWQALLEEVSEAPESTIEGIKG